MTILKLVIIQKLTKTIGLMLERKIKLQKCNIIAYTNLMTVWKIKQGPLGKKTKLNSSVIVLTEN